MGRRGAGITAVAGWVPPTVLTNFHLEKFVETSDTWIRERTGIRERRILVERDRTTSDMAVYAIHQLLRKRGLAPEDIDLVICCTVTPDHVFPATANIICDKAGLRRAWGFDLEAACSGFLYGLACAVQFVQNGMYERVLVVGAERMSAIMNYHDRTTCVIFGDGAGVVLVEPVVPELGVQVIRLYSDGSGRHALFQKAGGALHPPTIETVLNREHYVYQEGRAVFGHAVRRFTEVIEEVMDVAGLRSEEIDWLVPHQANLRIIKAVARTLRLPMEKVMVNIHKFGNTTSATIPLCLAEWEPRLRTGDRLILATFGGGFTWGAIYLRWAYDGSLVPESGRILDAFPGEGTANGQTEEKNSD